jgi:hypothetical protein
MRPPIYTALATVTIKFLPGAKGALRSIFNKTGSPCSSSARKALFGALERRSRDFYGAPRIIGFVKEFAQERRISFCPAALPEKEKGMRFKKVWRMIFLLS